ncbi:MAG: O-antigen ligase family protein [Pirellulales bacterium]|nr:O-antigen ligase family protein [Pirellulales bacterium]
MWIGLIVIAVTAVVACIALAVISRDHVLGLCGAIFASAILLTPELPVVREKLTLCEGVMCLTWLAMLLRPQRLPALLPSQRVAVRRGVAFMAVIGVSLLLNTCDGDLELVRSLVETVNYLYGFGLFLTVVLLVDSWDKWKRCLWAWCGGTVIVCAVAVWSLAVSAPVWARDEFTGRISSTLRMSNQLPGYCIPVLTLVVMTAAMKDSRRATRLACTMLAVGIAIAVAGCGSRMGFLMLCFSAAMILWIGLRTADTSVFSRKIFLGMGAIAAAGILYVVASVWLNSEQSYAAGTTSPYERSTRLLVESLRGERSLDDTRTDQLHLVLAKTVQRPLFGVGPANFTAKFHVHEIHNTYAAVLGEEGIFGLLALIWWLAGTAYNGRLGLHLCRNTRRRLIITAVLIGFASLLLYGVAMFGLRQRPLWLMCGLVVALPRVTRRMQCNGPGNRYVPVSRLQPSGQASRRSGGLLWTPQP